MRMWDVNKWMREQAKWFLIIICVVIMVTWLVPWNYLVRGRLGPQGKIFGRAVSGQDVAWLAKTILALNRGAMRGDAAIGAAWQVLILAEEAKKYGISIDDNEIVNYLGQKGRFPSKSGLGYDTGAYAAFLERANIPQQAFESSLKPFLSAIALERTVLMSVTLPQSEAWLWYALENERVMAEYIALRAEAFAPLVTADDKSLQEFYEEHKNSPPDRDPNGVGYLEPEEVSIEYVLCPYSRYLDTAVVTQQQVNAYYEAHKDQYALSAQAAQPAPAGKPNEAPKFKPLAEVAPQIEAMLREEEAARAVDAEMKGVNDEIAAQTEVPFGSEEVRTANFGEIAKKFDLIHQVTALFPADHVEAILPGARDLQSKAFGQSAASIHQPSVTLDARDGKFVFQILKIQDPRPAPFEAVRKQVERDYRTEKGYELVQEMADLAMKDHPTSLDAAAAKIEAAVTERLKTLSGAKPQVDEEIKSCVQRGKSDFFTRAHAISYMGHRFGTTTGLPGNYDYSNFIDEAFALKDDEVGKALEPEGARAVFLLKRVAVKPADRAEFEKSRASDAGELLALKRDAVLQSWLADVRQAAKPSAEVMKYLSPQAF
jgi:hypothetical protein